MPDPKKTRTQVLKDLVQDAQKRPNRSTADVPFRGKYISLVKIEVRTDFPMYRIQSGRTHKRHMAYLRKHPELPKNFFDDPEDPKVQAAQHEILVELIGDEELDEDLKEKDQRTPIVLTDDGYIVDGNRRTAALRNQKKQFATAVVLPKADSLDIFETEFELQLVRDTKADYDWLDELIHLRYGVEELNGSLETFAKRKRISTDALKAEMAKLSMVEMYLDWLGEPKAFDRIPDEERGGSMAQAFEDLTQRMRSKSVKNLQKNVKDAIKHACFAAIQAREGYMAIRNIINQLMKNPAQVLERISQSPEVAKELKNTSTGANGKKDAAAKKDDPLAVLAAAETTTTPGAYVAIGSLFSKPATANAVVGPLVTAVANMDEEEKDSRKQSVYLIERAETTLAKVDLSPATDDLDVVAKALARVDDQVHRLIHDIANLQKQKNK
jgi:hypothetical protein